MPEISARLQFAIQAVKEAGAIAMRYYQAQELRVDLKRDRSVVTQADREIEMLLRSRIEAKFPQDNIVGEEFGKKDAGGAITWYLDPIDGTDAYMRGVPLFGNMMAAESDDGKYLGIVFLPALGELVYATSGRGTWWVKNLRWNQGEWQSSPPVPARVSSVSNLKEALFCTTWMRSYEMTQSIPLFNTLCAATGNFRGWGDCYGHLLVATGRAEIMVDPVMNVWDNAPLRVILEEAGGTFTTMQGEATIHGPSGVSTNGVLYKDLMRILNAPVTT